jgi:hypothetical protein
MDDTFAGHDIKPETDILSLSLLYNCRAIYIYMYFRSFVGSVGLRNQPAKGVDGWR